MSRTTFDYSQLFFTPAEMSTLYVASAEKLRRGGGLTWGIPSLDEAMVPLRGGDIVGIIARPGHGKSTVLAYLASKVAADLVRAGRQDRCVVYITLEQSVEEMETFFQVTLQGLDEERYSVTDLVKGRPPMDWVRANALRRVNVPIWLMGRSTQERRQVPRMTVEVLYAGLEAMERLYGIRPALVCLDYIQIVPVESRQERNEQVSEAVIRAKNELAIDLDCPMAFGIQASRAVDTREDRVPGISDCQHASALEQASDKLFGFWRPWLTVREKTRPLRYAGADYPVTQNLLVGRLQKQRFAPAGQTFILDFAPQFVSLADWELAAPEPPPVQRDLI